MEIKTAKVAITVLYGGMVGVLYTLHASWASGFTLIGAIVIGLMWAFVRSPHSKV